MSQSIAQYLANHSEGLTEKQQEKLRILLKKLGMPQNQQQERALLEQVRRA